MQLQPNTMFANRYQLERLLGRGGFSEVWLAKDTWTHLYIALKVYAPGQGMDANGLQDFCGELANVFDLNHTNLLKPTHVDSWNDMPYLIMAYCSQGSLAGKIGKMSEEQIWKMIHDVASGLAYLHDRDVVHQDIKPDNILVDEFGNYVITDFGISTRARSTLRKSVVGGSASGGTTAYMGPERFSRQPAPTKASDIWSFGAMLYEVLEGVVPFGEVGGGLQKGGAEIPLITVNVSDALKFTIYKMLSKETWDRPRAEALVTWSQDPQSIEIDYTLLAGDEEPQPVETPTEPIGAPSRPTQRFSDDQQGGTYDDAHSVSPYPESAPQIDEPAKPTAKPKSKSKAWIGWMVAVVFLVGATYFGIDEYQRFQWEKQYVLELHSRHTNTMNDLNGSINAATIDNIDVIQQAIEQLGDIKIIEEDAKYDGVDCYSSKHQELLEKVNAIYIDVNNRYLHAPEGSETARRNMLKRRQLSEYKKQL